jgi:uncharacterized protein YjdB
MIATVSTTGGVTGVGAGTATIKATSEGKSGAATVTVQLTPVVAIAITPSTAAIYVSQTTTLVGRPLDQTGNVLSGRTITWSSSNGGIAAVSASGVVTGIAVGTVTITATSEGKSASAAVTVASRPATVSIGTWTSIGPHNVNGQFATLASGKLQALAVFAADANIMYAGGGLGSGNQGPFTESGVFRQQIEAQTGRPSIRDYSITS